MPIEYRLIQFRGTEVQDALDRWMRSNTLMNQYGRIDGVDLDEEKKKIRVAVHHYELRGRSRRNAAVTLLNHDEFSQIMIIYCKDRGIPLARNGKKTFRLLDGKVALYYAMS